MKKSLIAAAILAASVSHAPLMAQEASDQAAEAVAAALQVGATVYGPDGAEVGTIESLPAGNAVVFTGTQRATLPAEAFGKNENGLLISMTKAQLEEAVSAAEAQASTAMTSALVADAEIKSSDGVVVGSVQKVDGDNVIVDLPEGQAITLQKQHLTADESGLKLVMSAAEFQAAVSAAASVGAAAQPEASADAAGSTPAQPETDTAATQPEADADADAGSPAQPEADVEAEPAN